MGAAHSRARPGTGPAKVARMKRLNANRESCESDSTGGYFILCIKTGDRGDRVKVVNASGSVLKLLTAIIVKNAGIVKSGWDRHLAFSYKLQKNTRGRHSLIQLTAELLLTLYRAGWEPMTPIDLPGQSTRDENGVTVMNMQTAICFRRNPNTSSIEQLSTSTPLNSSFEDMSNAAAAALSNYHNNGGLERHDCLCLETYHQNCLGFHDVPNALLLDLVQCVQQDWLPGLYGISAAVNNVISDYSLECEFPVLPGTMTDTRRYLHLKGTPWSRGEEGADLDDAICAEKLTLSLIACLARAQYKLQIAINMDTSTRVFFFIKDKTSREVRVPTFCGVGLGEKNGLYVYEPTITRTQTSFFRSRNKGKSLRKRIRASMRRKSTKEKQKKLEQSQLDTGVDTVKPRKTSNLLTVEDSLRQLSMGSSDTEIDTEHEP